MTEAFASRIQYLGGHRFWVEFTDGCAAEWDYSGVLHSPGPLAAALRNEDFAAQVFLVDGAPTWPNGWDVSPEALYHDLAKVGALQSATARA